MSSRVQLLADMDQAALHSVALLSCRHQDDRAVILFVCFDFFNSLKLFPSEVVLGGAEHCNTPASCLASLTLCFARPCWPAVQLSVAGASCKCQGPSKQLSSAGVTVQASTQCFVVLDAATELASAGASLSCMFRTSSRHSNNNDSAAAAVSSLCSLASPQMQHDLVKASTSQSVRSLCWTVLKLHGC
jgi:hypothetical protein